MVEIPWSGCSIDVWKMRKKQKGIVIINTGEGKGKTTAAMGILMRAIGQGLRTCMIQFVKAETGRWGEIKAAEKLGIEWHTIGDGFTWNSKDIVESAAKAQHGWKLAQEKKLVLLSSKIDNLKNQNDKVRKASTQATEEAVKLKSAIIAVFSTIKVENDKLIMNLPTTLVRKRINLFKTINRRVIKDQKTASEIMDFQNSMDAVEQDIMGKISHIEKLFKDISTN